MTRDDVVKKILDIMFENKFISDTENVDLDASLTNKYEFTSIRIVELIVAIELEFNFEFDDTQLELNNYENINTVVDNVVKQLQTQN